MNIQNNNQIVIEGETMEVETVEGVEGIAGVFEQIDGPEAQPEGAAQPEAQAAPTQLEEMTAMLFVAGKILAMKYPSLATVFTQAKCLEVAKQVNPLFEYMGWKISIGGVFALWAHALTAIVMLAMEIKGAVAADVAEAMRQAAEQSTKVNA